MAGRPLAVAFGVWHDGAPVGFQELEADRFATLRTVESSSWLVPSARGLGIGKEMRAVVLALAFDHLGAKIATSGAWESNAASLGVSRALGYSHNGWFVQERDGEVGRQRRAVLEREQCDASRWPATVSGLPPCLTLFGIGTAA